MPALVAEGLIKSVGQGRAIRRVLDGVSLAVESDEVVAVLGRSGSGKSTLLHVLGGRGLDAPDAGRVTVAGQQLTGRRSSAVARVRLRHIGFVFQQFQLIEELSGRALAMVTHEPDAAAIADRVLALDDRVLHNSHGVPVKLPR